MEAYRGTAEEDEATWHLPCRRLLSELALTKLNMGLRQEIS